MKRLLIIETLILLASLLCETCVSGAEAPVSVFAQSPAAPTENLLNRFTRPITPEPNKCGPGGCPARTQKTGMNAVAAPPVRACVNCRPLRRLFGGRR